MVMGIKILNKITRDSLTEKVTCEQRHAVGKELNPADTCGKDVVQRTANAKPWGLLGRGRHSKGNQSGIRRRVKRSEDRWGDVCDGHGDI